MENEYATPLPASQAVIKNGPVTTAGKLRSSRNAEKHGMYSTAILLHNESREDHLRQFAPATRAETDLVDQMLAATWRPDRALRNLLAIRQAEANKLKK